ncbi:MAG: ABC transporter permease [Actinomycetota bacterium]
MTDLSRSTFEPELNSPGRRAWISVPAVMVAAHVVLAFVAPWLPLQPVAQQNGDAILQGPTAAHWLGTDGLGRDVLARTLWGGRPSIGLALASVVVAALLGFLIGTAAALAGGWVDELVMRINDVLLALPSLLVLLLVASFVGRDASVLIVTLALMYAPPIARLVRTASLNVLTRDFVVAARLRGASRWELVVGEVLPNIRGVVLTEVAMQFTWILLAFSSLSFLGLGANPPTPEWGLMIAESRTYMTIAPLPVVAPIVMLASLVLAVNAIVDRRGSDGVT